MKVYIVTHGDHCEGGNVLGVFTTFEGAEAAALKLIAEDKYGNEWRLEWDGNMDPDGPDGTMWAGGCEWVMVGEWPLHGTPANASSDAFASAPSTARSNAQSL